MISFLKAGLLPVCKPGLSFFSLLLLLICLSGCAGQLEKARKSFYNDQPEQALEILQEGDSLGNRNRLLSLMEQGVILHQLGRYQESTKVLLDAAAMVRKLEMISASEQLGSLVTSEWLTQYRGEYSERLWIHSYLMMNFLLLGQSDGALVEAKQALEILGKYPDALKGDYFTRGLIALCFSQSREDNDAFLVYRKLADDLPTAEPVAADLVQIASRLGMIDEVEHYRSALPKTLPSGDAELVLFIAAGRIPQKRPGNVVLPPSIRFSFPYYPQTPSLQLSDPAILPSYAALPPLTADFAALVRQSLQDRKVRIIAKETARVAAKEALSQAAGRRGGDDAEALLRLTLFLLEEPDTRSWSTLPASMMLLRIPLPAGSHRLQLQVSTCGHGRKQIKLPEFQMHAGQRVFYSLRF